MLSVGPTDIARIEVISRRVESLKTTVNNELINTFEMEELFDEIYGIFKSKMDNDNL
jgi:hypothetical protein